MSEIEILKNRIADLEKQNSELDAKLSNAYKINARESSLEAEKVRANLSREFTFLFDDFLEFENAENTQLNFESLKAIIKKAFRAVERSGINFKS